MWACQPAPCPASSDRGDSALFEHEATRGTLRRDGGLDDGLLRRARTHPGDQVMRRVAGFDAPWSLPAAGESRLNDAANAKVSFDVRDPACQSPRIGEGVPQVGGIGVEHVFHAHGSATVVDGAQRTRHATDVHCVQVGHFFFLFLSCLPRATSVMEPIQTLLPQISIGRQPAVDVGQGLWSEAVDAELPIAADIDEAGVPQDLQVAGCAGTSDRQERSELARARRLVAQGLQHDSAALVGECMQRVVHGLVCNHMDTYPSSYIIAAQWPGP